MHASLLEFYILPTNYPVDIKILILSEKLFPMETQTDIVC